MARPLGAILTSLLDKTGSLGVGLADTNGLLLQSCGLHGGTQADEVAAHLLGNAPTLTPLVEDRLVESILIGEKYCFYLRWLEHGKHFLYTMTLDRGNGGIIRYSLREAAQELAPVFGTQASSSAARQRLEQPRKFPGGKLVR